MRSMLPSCHLLLWIVTLAILHTHGQSQAQTQTTTQVQTPASANSRNSAAAMYLRALDRYNALRMSDQEYRAVWQFEVDSSAGPSPLVRQVMNRIEPAINVARRAAHQQHPDFGVELGPNPTTDHLTAMRTLVWLMNFDVQYRIANEDMHGAADRIATIYRMAEQAAHDPTMTGSVVGYSLYQLGERSMKYALDHAAISQDNAAVIMRALQQFDDEDPFRVRAAIAAERERSTRWMIEQYSGEGGRDRFVEEIEATDLLIDDLPETVDDFDQAQLEADLEAADRMMQSVVDAFSQSKTDAVMSQLGRVHEQVAAGEFGALAPQIALAHIDRYSMLLNARTEVAARRAYVQGILDGTRDPMDGANAAVWYMRAIAVLPRIDPQRFELLRQYAEVHDRPASDEMLETLATLEVQTILTHLEKATSIRRCDFEYTTPPWPVVVRRYHPGMRDLARLLVADASRHVHAGSEEGYAHAANRIAMTHRLCSHLAEDKSITSSLIAHDAFRQNDALAEAAIAAKYIHGERLGMLHQSMRYRSTDPFGYEAAIKELRTGIEKYIIRLMQEERTSNPPAASSNSNLPFARARKFVADASPERLLWLRVIFDQSEQRIDRTNEQANLHLRHLDEVINADAFNEAAAQADVVRRLVVRGEFDAIEAYEPQPIADLTARQAAAFEALKAALNRTRRGITTPATSETQK